MKSTTEMKTSSKKQLKEERAKKAKLLYHQRYKKDKEYMDKRRSYAKAYYHKKKEELNKINKKKELNKEDEDIDNEFKQLTTIYNYATKRLNDKQIEKLKKKLTIFFD